MDDSHAFSGIDTVAVHGGRDDLTALGVHALPLDLSTTYPVDDAQDGAAALDAWCEGAGDDGRNPVYARLHNPTVARFESAIAQLEGGEAAVAFATGMAAITATLLALPAGRRHVVGVRPLYGTTDHLLDSGLLGTTVTWTTPDAVAGAIRPDTGLVMVESPQNPTCGLVDIAAICRAAGGVPVLVDNTFATPVLQNPLALGASFVLHSATKAIGGHGDAMGGVVVCSSEHAAPIRQVRVATGALLHPMGAYQLHRGICTLPVRVRAMQAGAQALAERLAGHPAVRRVHYPGLAGQDPEGLVGRQMRGPGTILAFELAGGESVARRTAQATSLITHAVSLGSTDTLLQHPASLTHRVMAEDDRARCGIGPELLRLSVGLEDPDDLWSDLSGALDAATAAATDTGRQLRAAG